MFVDRFLRLGPFRLALFGREPLHRAVGNAQAAGLDKSIVSGSGNVAIYATEKLIQHGAKPVIQRFKGLGEMNPEQLWETTLDPEARTLLRVKIDEQGSQLFLGKRGGQIDRRRGLADAAFLVRDGDDTGEFSDRRPRSSCGIHRR